MSDAIYQRGRHVIPIRSFTNRLAAVTVLLLDLGQVGSLRFARQGEDLRPVELLFGVESVVSCTDEISIHTSAIALLKGPVDASCVTGCSLLHDEFTQRTKRPIHHSP
jgi:hypothetical protein